jgi:probable phosphoglycerate mutase
MKKLIAMLFVLMLSAGCAATAVDGSTVFINGQKTELTDAGAPAKLLKANGDVYLPLRATGKALDLYTEWDEDNNTVLISEVPVIEPSQELTIYLVRHGKTFFNTTGQVQGFIDSPLTDVGIAQAQAVGRSMANIQFTTAFTGRLGRHIDTAQAILDNNENWTPKIIQNIGWNEWNYGGYEGKTNAEMWNPIFQKYGFEFDENWTHYDEVVKILGDKGVADAIAANDPLKAAEKYDEIVARANAAMAELIEVSLKAGGGNVLVVSSGGMIPTLLEIFFPGHEATNIDNCSVSVIKYADGKLSIVQLNDLSYRDETRK